MPRNDRVLKSERSAQRVELTSAQRGIWYAQHLDPENPTYQIGQYLDLRGRLDTKLLSIAVTKTVADLDALSLRFAEDDNGPYARIARPRATKDLLEVVDLSQLDQEQALEQALARMDAELRTARDLDGPDLFGSVLFKLTGDRSLFFQRVHHVMLDGYSAVIALQYLSKVYTRLAKFAPTGRVVPFTAKPLARLAARISSPLPTLADLNSSLDEYDVSPQHAADEAYWRDVLADDSVVTGLEGTSGAVAREVTRISVPLGPQRTAEVAGLGRDVAKTLLGAVAVYLSMISGEEQVSLGLPVTARRGRIAKTTPSMLSSILPLRLRIDPTQTLAEVVRQSGDLVRATVRHQQFPANTLPEAPAHPGPSVNLLPVIDEMRFGSTRGEVNILSTGPVRDLSVVLSGVTSESADATLQLEGDAALHTQDSLTEHAERLLDLLDAMIADPADTRVTDVSLVSGSAAEKLLQQGEGENPGISSQRVLEAFAEIAAHRPDDVAVVASDGTMTFAAVQHDAIRLANHLMHLGVQPGDRVAVRIERTLHLPVVVLAVLAAGGAYVPIDPEYPIDRVAAMLEDAEPALLLTTSAQRDQDSADGASWSARTVTVDGDTAAWRSETDSPSRLPTLSADGLAYVVFTSGSTGRPKGVGVDRIALRNLYQHHLAELFEPAAVRLGRTLRVAHTAGLSFDAAWDPLLWLFAGHQLHIVADDVRRDPQRLIEYFASEKIDAIETTPSFAEALVAAGMLDQAEHPTEIALGGEAVGPELWDALADRPDVHAVNLYGPTESTVNSLVATIEPDRRPHLGDSIRNARHYVLGANLDPVPDRAVGELYLAGANVARGYLGKPERSAERFVADPFALDGSRMYRTGDLVRRRNDGSLRFVGRMDDQVKIRGYRVELEEIEAAMRLQDHVVQAAAIVEGAGATARIVGYVTGSGDLDGLGAAVREGLRRALPDYMVPATVMALSDLPMTPNGKLDRHALPAPERAGTDPAQRPQTSMQQAVADEFAHVLEIDSVGIDEDFFAAGGHSLLATRLAARLSDRLERTVTVRDVFEQSTVAALAERVSDPGAEPAHPRLQRTKRPDPVPVSLTQRRLWFLNRLEPRSAAYNIPVVLELDGPLDVPALRAALSDVTMRHEPLRTVVPFVDGEPVQQVRAHNEAAPTFVVVDVPADRIEDATRHEVLRPFDVTHELPLRAALMRVGPSRHVLVITFHHIAADGWSLAPFARDLGDAYTARSAGEEPKWDPLPVDYADFALWQREYLGEANDPSSELARQLEFWHAELVDAPPEIDLPRDRARGAADPANPQQRGVGGVQLELDSDQHAALTALAAEHRTSLFIVLQSAVATMLKLHGAGDDVVLGTPVAGRADPQLDELVGFFVNTVTLRTSLEGDPTPEELLQRVRTRNTEVYGHQDVPFDSVVEALRPPRDADRHPIFQVLLTLQNTGPAHLDLGDVAVTLRDQVTSAGVKADLLVDVQTPDGDQGPLLVELGFDRALFDELTLTRMRDSLERVLTTFVRAPGRRISRIPTVDPDTRNELEQHATGNSLPTAATILERLAATIAHQPGEIALSDATGEMTFAELDAQVQSLATGLAAQGVERGDRVVIALPRSSEAMTLLLATLRAGAVAVPVDVSYPDARLAQIIVGAKPTVLVIDDPDRAASVVSAAAPASPHVVGPTDLTEAAADGFLPEAPRAADIAYLVYTSGTTGEPKGVQVAHAALANVLAHHEDTLIRHVVDRLDRTPRMLHLTGLGFDAAWDPILWLVAGTTVQIADDQTRTDAEAVVRTVMTSGIDVLETTPSYATQLCAVGLLEDLADRCDPLTLALGGETVPVVLWDRLAAARTVHGINLYGPSESTVDAVLSPITPGPVAIGTPVANVTARVLDDFLRPVPYGVLGELYLSGASLAHGYRGRPTETAARFVADPHRSGDRMYRTGDIVRRLPDGRLQFVRRDDDQVKLRGYRVETGDVVHALEQLPGVRSAVVRVLESNSPDSSRLVAWAAGDVEEAQIRQDLAQVLPGYMVPTAIAVLDQIPLTSNGKVDVSSLPEPVASGQSRAPATDEEKAVCRVVGEVLGVRDVGLDDDFFALGGHSLLAVTLMGRLQEELGTALPLRTIFQTPTPAGLLGATGTAAVTADPERPVPPPLRAWVAEHPREDGADLPVSPNQARLWFLNRLNPGTAEFSVVLQAEFDGDLDVDAFARAIDDLVARHEVLRTTYPETDDGRPVQRIQPPPTGLLADQPVDLTAGFDLSTELPVRAALVRTGQQQWRLDLVIHHIATDGGSLPPLVRDIATAYAARTGGTAALQRPRQVQYADHARMQRALAESDATRVEESLEAWTQQLAGIPDELELPADGRRPESASRAAAQHRFVIPASVARAVQSAATNARASGFHAWLAALAGYLHRIGAGDDVVIGSPSAGRADPDVADLIGFFVNTLPLRMDFTDNPDLITAIGRARTATLHALEHEAVPFEQIVEAMAPERRLGRHPLFQTMLSVVEPTDLPWDLPGVTTTPIEPGTTGSAKLDLSFTLRPQATGEVEGVLEYDASMFSSQAASGLIDRWLSFLEGAAQVPDRCLLDVPVEPSVTRVPAWPAAPVAGSEPTSVLDALDVALAARPDAIALRDTQTTLTGADLAHRIDTCAAGLVAAGVNVAEPVAIALPRGVEALTALLAVWKAGAVAVPVDTELPEQRVATMLRTAGVRLVLHDHDAAEPGLDVPVAAAAAGIRADHVVRPIDLDPAGQTGRRPVSPETPAFLIFTSGTTGEPKAVQVPHRAPAALLASHLSTLMPDPADRRVRMAHTTGLGFDASMDPLLWLAAGHEVYVVDEATRRDPQALAELLAEHRIEAWESTPSHVAALTSEPRFATAIDHCTPAAPFLLLLGGEPLDSGLWQWLAARDSVAAWNLYGPTETGVDAMVAPVQGTAGPELGATTTTMSGYVLDSRLRPAPVGSVGELWLAGPQLAHGYRSGQAATADRFIADPFAGDGSRMYRTGDLVLVRDAEDDGTGAVAFRGRSDAQVKIRGHRVEPGEVEAQVRTVDGVAQAVVRPVEGARGQLLGAWVVLSSGADPETVVSRLREELPARLPDYMVPAGVRVIDSVPLTANGKVDPRALPDLHFAGGGRAPHGAAERAVAEAFERTLAVSDVRADDSFFALGGHSFVAQPTIHAVNAALDAQLPVQALFAEPTVAGLARLAQTGSVDAADSLRPILPLRRDGVGEPLFAVHPATGLAWGFTAFISGLRTDRPVLGVQVPGIAPDEKHAPSAPSLADLLDEYVDAIQAEQPHGPYHLVGYSLGGRIAHHIAARLQASGEKVALLAVLDAYPSDNATEAEPATQVDVWRDFLDAVGIVTPEGDFGQDQVLAALQEINHPLADVPAQVVPQIVNRHLLLSGLIAASPPPIVDGDLHVFEATRKVPAQRPDPPAWAAYVRGAVTSSQVDADHHDMLTVRAMADIQPVLDNLLET